MATKNLTAREINAKIGDAIARDPKNLALFLVSTDEKLRRDAESIKALIDQSKMKPNGDANNAGTYEEQVVKTEKERNAKADKAKAEKKNRREWEDWFEKAAANQKAGPGNEPFPNLKKPKGPMPLDMQGQRSPGATTNAGTNDLATDRYEAMQAAVAAGKKVSGPTNSKPITAGTTLPTPPASTGNRSGNSGNTGNAGNSGNSGNNTGNSTGNKKLTIDEIFALVGKEFGAIDEIFKTDPELKKILMQAIGPDGVPGTKDDWTKSRFTNAVTLTTWFKSNATTIQQIGFYRRQYDDLVGKVSEDQLKLSNYGQLLENAKDILQQEAIRQGAYLTDEALDYQARQVVDNNLTGNTTKLRNIVASYIKYDPNGTSGVAGAALRTLRATALANGIQNFDERFAPQLKSWLSEIAKGQNIEYYQQQIRSVMKTGLPEQMQQMMDAGMDLTDVVAPYRSTMANVLELTPDQINLYDPALTMAYRDKTMNLFDYERALRQDERWQYTKQARDSVFNSTLGILRNFGFTG